MSIKHYVGLDAHSKNCYFVVLDKRGRITTRKETKTREFEILAFLKSLKGKTALVFEEAAISQWLYILLRNEVEKLIVCKVEKSNGPKTDFIDAKKLANALRTNDLIPVFHSADKFMELRTITSAYEDTVQELTREKNRYSALFRQSAIIVNGSSNYKKKEIIKQLPYTSQRICARALFKRIALLDEQKKQFKDIFIENARKHLIISLLMTIPGIGPVRANELAAIIVTPHRFATKYHYCPKQLCS
jgi:transposase